MYRPQKRRMSYLVEIRCCGDMVLGRETELKDLSLKEPSKIVADDIFFLVYLSLLGREFT